MSAKEKVIVYYYLKEKNKINIKLGDSIKVTGELKKPQSNTTENLFAGFPHLYFYSNLEVPYRFLNKCIEYGGKNEFR